MAYRNSMQDWRRIFFTAYAGQAFSLLGSASAQFCVLWFLTVRTQSAITLTVATIVTYIPTLIFAPLAGICIDRFNRSTIMILADSLVALSSVALAAVFLLPDPPIILIYFVLFVRGTGNTFHSPALQAAIPMFVPEDMLTKAGGWGNLIISISNILGPALGSVLLQRLSMSVIMMVDVVGAAFAVCCLLSIHLPDVQRNIVPTHLGVDLKEGLNIILNNKPLVASFWPIIISTFLFMPLTSLYPLLIRMHFGGGTWDNALVEIAFSIGMLISSVFLGILGGDKHPFSMISISIASLGFFVAIGGALSPSWFWLFVLCAFVMGGSGPFFNVPLIAYIQRTVPEDKTGKVLSLITSTMMISTPCGLLLAGPVSEIFGVTQWFWGSGVLLFAIGIGCLVFLRKYDRCDNS